MQTKEKKKKDNTLYNLLIPYYINITWKMETFSPDDSG